MVDGLVTEGRREEGRVGRREEERVGRREGGRRGWTLAGSMSIAAA